MGQREVWLGRPQPRQGTLAWWVRLRGIGLVSVSFGLVFVLLGVFVFVWLVVIVG